MAETVRLPLHTLPQGGPPLVVAVMGVDTTPVDHYVQGMGAGDVFRAGEPLVAVARPEPLTVLDRLEDAGESREGDTFRISFTLRRYGGDLAANVEAEVLVQSELGRLEAGAYQVEAMERALWFMDTRHPEQSEPPVERAYRLGFQVR